jgi:hypothetical protein
MVCNTIYLRSGIMCLLMHKKGGGGGKVINNVLTAGISAFIWTSTVNVQCMIKLNKVQFVTEICIFNQ